VYGLFDVVRSVNSHDVPGGTAFVRVREQIEELEKTLKNEDGEVSGSR
jgi:argininosuccinate lyase